MLFVTLISREEEIRTLDAVTHILPFQGSPFNHSGTSLSGCKYKEEILVSKCKCRNPVRKSDAHFSAQWLAEHVDAGAAAAFAGENVHHFGDGGFGGDVGAADDADLLQEFAGLVLAL